MFTNENNYDSIKFINHKGADNMLKNAKKIAKKLNDWLVGYTNTEIFAEKEVGNDHVKVYKDKVFVNGELIATSKGIMHETDYIKKPSSIKLKNEIEYALVHMGKIEGYL